MLDTIQTAFNNVSGSINDTLQKINEVYEKSEGKGNYPIVDSILNTDWTLSNEFEVFIFNPFIASKMVNENVFAKDVFDKCVVSFTLPEISSQEIDNVIGGLRRNNVRMYESFRFSITFRDYDENILRKTFTNIWVAKQYMYPDDITSTIVIQNKGNIWFYGTRCFVTNISGGDFNQGSNEIQTFTVQFVTSDFSNTYLNGFGLDSNYEAAFQEF
jgi:hypothetical protein